MTPALCGILLKHNPPPSKVLFAKFNRFYDNTERSYQHKVVRVLRRLLGMMLLYGVLGLLMWRSPDSFLPNEDQGEIILQASQPTGAAASRTDAVNKQITDWFLTQGKDNTGVIFTISGFKRRTPVWRSSSRKAGNSGKIETISLKRYRQEQRGNWRHIAQSRSQRINSPRHLQRQEHS
ncbi:efflux RND transporter permease subunit [Brenneria sp. 4F2]|nr:efflux RND transporter permease subunit [Brenneria bubanii]